MDIKALLQEFVDGSTPDEGVLLFYLRIYLGDSNWPLHLQELRKRLLKLSNNNEDEAKKKYFNQVSCAIQLPVVDRSLKLDTTAPHRLLFGCPSFQQFGERDWLELLRHVAKDDLKISIIQKDALALGYIKNIEYQPNTRQAFRWLLEKAEESGDLSDTTRERLANIVRIYGGAVIAGIFTRHEEVIKRVANWRTGYFFERQIIRVYTPEQIQKIKKKELETSNQRLVARI